MLSFLVGGMLPGPRHASRGALLLGRTAAPQRLVGPWLCSSAGTAEPAAPTVPLPDGVLVVDKPQNWTSFDVVAKVRANPDDPADPATALRSAGGTALDQMELACRLS